MVPIVLLCVAMMVSSFPVNRGEHDFGDNGKITDQSLGESASSILVHNTFHLPAIDEMRGSDMFQKPQFPERSMVHNRHSFLEEEADGRVHNRNNFQQEEPDGIRTMDYKIDSLIKSNSQILDILKALEHKINRTLETSAYQDQESENEQLPIHPRSTIDLMSNMEVKNLLNQIHQYITSSNGEAKQTDVLKASEIQVIKNFISAIENEKVNTMRSSTPDVVNQVLTNSQKTIQHLDEVSTIVKVIDERTNRLYDQSCRQGQKLSHGNRNSGDCPCGKGITHQGSKFSNRNRYGDCNCDKNGMIRKNQYDAMDTRNWEYGETYGNTKRDTTRVNFEPNKYNCHDLEKRKNGIYKFASQDELSNEAGRFFYERYCDFNTDGGAWTVIQRRFINDHQENFNRSWLDYKHGFGELDREFWFGNDFIHQLTSDEDVELRIVLEDTNGRKAWARYSVFRVDSEEYNYNLMISGYRGSFENGPLSHTDQEFSTYDRQNDNNGDLSCASLYGNGWWFNNCKQISTSLDESGVTWEDWMGSNLLQSSKMMVRPIGLWSGGDSGEDGYIYTSNTIDT